MTTATLVGGPKNGVRLQVQGYPPIIEVMIAPPCDWEAPATLPPATLSFPRGRYVLWEPVRVIEAAIYLWDEDAEVLRRARRTYGHRW